MGEIKHGDFTALAENYSRFRPGYSDLVLNGILGMFNKDPQEIDFVDIGAGTGIWTRMVAKNCCKAIAIEPNNEMRKHGELNNGNLKIEWRKGSAEETLLPQGSADLITMASSFHWTDFDLAIKEFNRVLRKDGLFAALWNPRLIEANPILVEIEEKLKRLIPDMKRVSSGRSEFCDDLTERLLGVGVFEDVLYMEGRHLEKMTPKRYIGIWESVNDIRVQAGEERFEIFLEYVKNRVGEMEYIEATYLTRVWIAKK